MKKNKKWWLRVCIALVVALFILGVLNSLGVVDQRISISLFISMLTLTYVVLTTVPLIIEPLKRNKKYTPNLEVQDRVKRAKYRKKMKNGYDTTLVIAGHYPPKTRLIIEDSVDKELQKANLGCVTGGKCFYKERSEIDYCELYMKVKNDSPKFTEILAKYLDSAFALPKTSLIKGPKTMIALGTLACLACYFDLYKMEEVEMDDYNSLMDNIFESLGDKLRLSMFWQASDDVNYSDDEDGKNEFEKNNPTMIAYYFYGESYRDIKDVIVPIMDNSIFRDAYRIEQHN